MSTLHTSKYLQTVTLLQFYRTTALTNNSTTVSKSSTLQQHLWLRVGQLAHHLRATQRHSDRTCPALGSHPGSGHQKTPAGGKVTYFWNVFGGLNCDPMDSEGARQWTLKRAVSVSSYCLGFLQFTFYSRGLSHSGNAHSTRYSRPI